MEALWFFWLRFCRAYNSVYDSYFWFSLGYKRSFDSAYESDSNSFASGNQPLAGVLSVPTFVEYILMKCLPPHGHASSFQTFLLKVTCVENYANIVVPWIFYWKSRACCRHATHILFFLEFRWSQNKLFFSTFKEVYFLQMVYNLINGFNHFGVILNTLNPKNLILRLGRFLLRQN